MKKSDCKRGKKGFIVRVSHSSDANPVKTRIVEVVIRESDDTVWVDDPIDDDTYTVEAKDIYATEEEARKKAIQFHSRELKRLLKEGEKK